MSGIRLRHRYHRNTLYLVPVLKKPTPKARTCNLCKVTHPCKTVHLHLNEGNVTVSEGVLADLKLAGLPDLDILGEVKQPPTLRTDILRAAQDAVHRKVTVWQR